MRNVLVTNVLLDANRVDNERVTLPTSDGVTVESRLEIVECLLGPVHQDATHLCVGLLDDRDLPAALQDLQRECGGHHAWHSIGKTRYSVGGERLPLRVCLADHLQ